jgi:large subunit ribosomal protein L22
MPEYGYALENFDKSRHVRASIRDKSTSHKHAREVAVAIKGMSIEKARGFDRMCNFVCKHAGSWDESLKR